MSRHQTAGRSRCIKVANECFENMDTSGKDLCSKCKFRSACTLFKKIETRIYRQKKCKKKTNGYSVL